MVRRAGRRGGPPHRRASSGAHGRHPRRPPARRPVDATADALPCSTPSRPGRPPAGWPLYPAQEEAVLEICVGRQRHPRHAHRVGQVARRPGRPRRRAGRRAAHLLHRAHQGAGVGEVLRAVPRARLRPRGHAHRRRRGQRRRAGHLLHGRDPGQHGAARGRAGRRRPGGDGRVPLLRRPRPGLGVAGAAAHAAPGPVPPDVGHARRHPPLRGRADRAHRPADRGTCATPPGPVPLDFEYRHTALHETIETCSPPAGRRSTSCTSPSSRRSSGPSRS